MKFKKTFKGKGNRKIKSNNSVYRQLKIVKTPWHKKKNKQLYVEHKYTD